MSTAPVRRRRPQHTDEALLSAACEVFAREGFAAATVSQIAARASTTKPTLYARFGAKADLYEAAVAHEADVVQAHLFAAYDHARESSVPHFIREAVNAWFAYAKARPDGAALLFGDHAGVHSPVPAQITENISRRIAETVDRFGVRAGQPLGGAAPVIAAMIVGTAINAVRRCLRDPALDSEAVAALTTAFLTSAIAGIDSDLITALGR